MMIFPFLETNHLRIDDFHEQPSISTETNSEEMKILPQRNRRKNPFQSKRSPNPSATTTASIPMILSLIDSLVDEKSIEWHVLEVIEIPSYLEEMELALTLYFLHF